MGWLISLLVGVLILEAYAWLPRVSEWLLDFAIRRLRPEDQGRCREEWNAQLDDLPNTMVRLAHALSFTIAANRINADFCGDKLAELDQQLKGLVDTHRHHVEAMATVKLNIEKNREALTSISISAQREQIAALKANYPMYQEIFQNLANSMEDFVHNFLRAEDRCYYLISDVVDTHNDKIDKSGILLRETLKRHQNASYLFRNRRESMKSLAVSLSTLEQDLNAVTMAVEQEGECSESDEPFNEYKRIKKVIHNAIQNVTKASRRLS